MVHDIFNSTRSDFHFIYIKYLYKKETEALEIMASFNYDCILRRMPPLASAEWEIPPM